MQAYECQVTYHKGAEFTCENYDWDKDVKNGDYYRVGFQARNNDTNSPVAGSATYYIEGKQLLKLHN